MREADREVEYKGHVIRIFADDDASNPRTEFDTFGRMICFHNRYDLGDKHTEDHEKDPQEFKNWIERNTARGAIISFPLYLYDHSGITMNTTGFHCPWDSGLVGWIYASKDMIRKEFNTKRITKKILEKAKKILLGEVATYDQYLTGEVYGYETVEKGAEEDEMYNRDVLDSCWGFFGDPDEYMIGEAKSVIDHIIEGKEKNAAESN